MEHQIEGTIVRVVEGVEYPGGFWPHQVAVEFSEPLPEVEPLLREMAGSSRG